jgi:hypothetical protein
MHMPPSVDEDDDGEVLLEDLIIEEYAPTTLRQPFGLSELPEVADDSPRPARSTAALVFRAAGVLIGLGVAAIALGALGRWLAPRPRFAWLPFGS